MFKLKNLTKNRIYLVNKKAIAIEIYLISLFKKTKTMKTNF